MTAAPSTSGPTRDALPAVPTWERRAALAFLTIDGVLVGLLSVGFVYLRVAGLQLPAVAVAAGLTNALLLWLAHHYASGGAWRFAPLAGWFAVVILGGASGPGGDLLLVLQDAEAFPVMMLVLFGAGLPLLLLVSKWLPEAGMRATGRSPRPSGHAR